MSDTYEDFEGDEPIEQQLTPKEEPKAEEPEEPQEEPKAEEAEKPKEETPMVPLSVMMERIEKERQRTIEQFQMQQREPEKIPDLLEDQDAFTGHVMRQIQQQSQNVHLNTSEMLARDKFGDEAVDAALEAAQAAGNAQTFLQTRHPWGEMVRWHQQQRVAAEIGTDPEAYKAKLRKELLAELQAEQAAKQIKSAPSLASETSIGGRRPPAAASFTSLEDILPD